MSRKLTIHAELDTASYQKAVKVADRPRDDSPRRKTGTLAPDNEFRGGDGTAGSTQRHAQHQPGVITVTMPCVTSVT